MLLFYALFEPGLVPGSGFVSAFFRLSPDNGVAKIADFLQILFDKSGELT